ncbi:Hypothetical predicted protein [Pelobates cultripes]|uniref:Uncharacterized protein n=1 Tax=Pelobates cultripes TaxID=61616 RepID=A0AAD1VVT6_PELCU|nr:Hypothetical predicted protein [Pelobates cultripes]
MATMPDPDAGSTCSEQALGDTSDSQSHLGAQMDPDALTPATKLDIRNLLLELKQIFAADMGQRSKQ